MYVRLGALPSYVQPANPTPQNDLALAAQITPSVQPVAWRIWRGAPPVMLPPVQTTVVPAGQQIIGYDAYGNPIYSGQSSTAIQPATVTASVTASPGGLTSWLQTGNNGIYAALAVGVLLILLTRRR